jgi:hypothetical protein
MYNNKSQLIWKNTTNNLGKTKYYSEYIYNEAGYKIEEASYDFLENIFYENIYKINDIGLTSEENYFKDNVHEKQIINKYDELGNLIQKYIYDYNGILINKITFKYLYDFQQNWIKKEIYYNDIHQLTIERKIEYY